MDILSIALAVAVTAILLTSWEVIHIVRGKYYVRS